jgi:hypothetical protein
MELPTGTVTSLFTDIEGSTRLLQQLGDAYRPVQDEHGRLRSAIKASELKDPYHQARACMEVARRSNEALTSLD